MGANGRDYERLVLEAAEGLAVRQIGESFDKLKNDQRYRIFNQAEQQVRENFRLGRELSQYVRGIN